MAWNDAELSFQTSRPFIANTTLHALRITIYSTIDLVEELFKKGYPYVLTGKFNQDCVEVGFLILLIFVPSSLC